MKKIIALLILIGLTFPFGPAFAASCKLVNKQLICDPDSGLTGGLTGDNRDFRGGGQATPSPTTPAPSTVAPLPTGIIQDEADAIAIAAAQRAKDTTDKGQTLGCGTAGEFGGSMSASLDKALKGMLSQLVGQGISAINGKVGDLLNSIASKAGPLAPLVNIVTSKIQEKISSTLNSLGQEVLSSFGGGAEQAVSGAAQALGLSNVGAIAGLGSMFGAAGVGVAVPVYDSKVQRDTAAIKGLSERIEKHSEVIQQMQKLFGYVTCVGNPAIAKTKNALLAQKGKAFIDHINTGGVNGGPLYIQDPRGDIKTAQETVVKDIIENRTAGMCSSIRPEVQEVVLSQYEYDNSISIQTQCTSGAESASGVHADVPTFDDWFAERLNPSSSKIFNVIAIGSAIREGEAEVAADLTLKQLAGGGWYNKTECRDDNTPPPHGYCLNGEIISIPGSLTAAQAAHAFTVPTEQLVEADEIGELIDSLSQGLLEFAFQNVNGLMGLSEDSGGGSYLDQMVTEEFSDDPGGTQAVMSGDLVGSLETELMYRDLVTLVINDLNNARATYREVVACYSQYTTTGTGTITPALARESLDLASTTISTALDPQIRDLTLLLNDSNASINELTSLIEQADNALSNEELVSIANQFNALQASGILHNSTDLQYLQTGVTTSIGTIETLLRDSQIKLSVCRAA